MFPTIDKKILKKETIASTTDMVKHVVSFGPGNSVIPFSFSEVRVDYRELMQVRKKKRKLGYFLKLVGMLDTVRHTMS